MEEFVTIEENVDYTLTEKKSKFIANLIRVNSKDEAENEIKKLKKNKYTKFIKKHVKKITFCC